MARSDKNSVKKFQSHLSNQSSITGFSNTRTSVLLMNITENWRRVTYYRLKTRHWSLKMH